MSHDHRTKNISQALGIGGLFIFALSACGSPTGSNIETQAAHSTSAAATDACFSACMQRPEATDDRCAEACASIGGDQCSEGCVDRGGDERDCAGICDRDSADDARPCSESCIAGGGDETTCRDACSERERLATSEERDETQTDSQRAYEDCVNEGGDPMECRQEVTSASQN